MSTKQFTIRNYYRREIPIDDGVDGEAVGAGEMLPLHIRRFSVGQLQVFQRGFSRLVSPLAERFIYRKPDNDEQSLRPDGRTYVVDPNEVERRRLAEMSPEIREQYEVAKNADDEFMTSFCSQAIADYISVDPSYQLLKAERDTGEVFTVRTGKDLVEVFGGNLSLLIRMTRAIHEENTWSPEKKRDSRSPSGSTRTLPTPAAAAAVAGATPVAIVAPVEPAASASSAGASAVPDPIPSGSDALETAT